MSDFLYSSKQLPRETLSGLLKSIHAEKKPACIEFHGDWGSLGVVKNHYCGFNPFEDERYIIIIIGGPLLKFPGAPCYSKTLPENLLTGSVFQRWKINQSIQWDKDLSGPFAVLCIDKKLRIKELVTDLVSFIPIYYTNSSGTVSSFVLGSHVEIIAKLANCDNNLDLLSLTEFIIHGTIQFPNTFYNGITQLPPASIINIDSRGKKKETQHYWLPVEPDNYPDFNEVAHELGDSIKSSVFSICEGRQKIGLFLTGGEDTRTIIDAIPKQIKKSAYIFVDMYNREAKIAKKIANMYDTPLHVGLRSLTHYIDNLKECSFLVGSQSESYMHMYGFHKQFDFMQMDAMLDGYWADVLLKGYWIPTRTCTLKGIPISTSSIITNCNGKKNKSMIDLGNESQLYVNLIPYQLSKVKKDIYTAVIDRKNKRYLELMELRPNSAGEWLFIWPITQDTDTFSITGNRRIFRHYGVFFDSDIIKIAAKVPQSYKINRKLFHAATKHFHYKSRFVPHSEGHFPYISTIPNIPLCLCIRAYRKIKRILKIDRITNHLPSTDWNKVIKTDAIKQIRSAVKPYYCDIAPIFKDQYSYDELFEKGPMEPFQQIRTLQVLFIRSFVNSFHL